MIRAIALILCLTATLFLVPAQGECGGMLEYESETEIECCVVVSSRLQLQVAEVKPKLWLTSDVVTHCDYIAVKTQKGIVNLPARILNCVFRE